MKKFIFKISIIIITIGIFFLVNYCINTKNIKSHPPIYSETTLAVGDSHIKSCIDPSLMENTINIAQPGEITFITYHKIKTINEHHSKKLERVVMSFSQANLSDFSDQKFQHPDHASEFLGRIYGLISLRDIENMPINYRAYIKTILQNMLLYPKKNHLSYIGSFKGRPDLLSKANIHSPIKRHYFYDNGKVRDFSNISLNYLDSIISYSQKNEIELYILNTPFHPSYIQALPPKFNIKMNELDSILNQKGIHFIEYNDMEFGDEYFSDYDHVNEKGAQKVTEILKTYIQD